LIILAVDVPLIDKEPKVLNTINRQSLVGKLAWQIEVSRRLVLESTFRPREGSNKRSDGNHGKK